MNFEEISMEKVHRISAKEAKENLENNYDILLIDVREFMEFNNDGHIEGAELIPIGDFEKDIEELNIEKDRTIYVYCRSGARSEVAATILALKGYSNVYNIGGILDWPYELVK